MNNAGTILDTIIINTRQRRVVQKQELHCPRQINLGVWIVPRLYIHKPLMMIRGVGRAPACIPTTSTSDPAVIHRALLWPPEGTTVSSKMVRVSEGKIRHEKRQKL